MVSMPISLCVRILIAVALLLSAQSASADKRVALVVGNAAYKNAPGLRNPRNDAAAMATVLREFGFEVVEGFDLDKVGMDVKLRQFASHLVGADTGLFFYAGHGLQVGGINYLVPVDAQLTTSAALDFETVRLDLVQRMMEREAKTNVIFLDACRDNPLARNLAQAMGTRGGTIGRGLAAAESGVGTLISYSTQPGNVALDGESRHSPFADALVAEIRRSDNDLSALLINVRRAVMKATENRQVPWEHSALTGQFYFRLSAIPMVPAGPRAEAPTCDGVHSRAGSRSRCIKFGETFKDCDFCPEMVVVQPGSVMLGQGHKVDLGQPFAMAKYEVSRGQFSFFVSAAKYPYDQRCYPVWNGGDNWTRPAGQFHKSFLDPGFEQTANHPATCLNWHDASAYAEWLAKEAQGAYRLPSEAEWQYVAVGDNPASPSGTSCEIGNIADAAAKSKYGRLVRTETCRDGAIFTSPSGRFRPNSFGIYDMIGNVSEWLEDCWSESFEGIPGNGSPRKDKDCTIRTIRGGSFIDNAQTANATARTYAVSNFQSYVQGFRVVRTFGQ